MIIENLDALKTWLSKTLEPICDADPSALAKYVVALVKKDKSEKELKALCIDQLDVFLQKETQIFVDKLFEAVGNRSYLPPSEQQAPAIKTELKLEKDEAKKDESSREDDRDKKFSRRVNHSPPQSSSRYSRDGRALRVPEDKRDELQMRNQLPDRALRRVEDRGKRDERPRKREYERNPPRRDSYRDRYNRRRGRSRSYSRSRSRSWSKDRMRDRERDRERERERGRERDHSRSRTRSRSRERDTAKPKYDREAGDRSEVVDGYAQPPLVSTATTSHFPVPSLSSTITVIAPTHHHSNNNNSSSISTTESWSDMRPDHAFPRGPPPPPQQPRKRCRDYDEKGFCMRGDMCPFDHGSDPVVVEDVNLPSILPFQPPPPQPPPGLPPPPPLMTPPPAQLRPPVPPPGSLPPSLPPVTGPPPPLPPLQGSGIVAPPNSIASSVPTIVTSGMRSSLPPPSAPLFSDSYDTDMYNPEAPSITSMSRPMQYRHRPSIQRPNLIGLTTGDMDQPHREKPPNHRVVMESDPRKRPAGPHDGNMPPKKPWFDKPSFGNHQGFQNRAPSQFHPPNSRLLVRQIPPDLNNISKLNAHFSQFGTIVNLQVAYQNDREGALVQFSNHSEAKRAMQSPEAVLGNRFIKVHWFRQDGPQGPPPSQQPAHPTDPTALPTSLKQSVKDRLGPLLTGPSEPPHDHTDASQNSAKMSVKERLGFPVKPALPVEKVFSTSKGLTKTVFNPAVLKAAQRNSEETLKKKQEAMRLQQDVQKKKQQILEKHIETQKLLISKLDQKKVVTPEDRAKIMQTLSSLTQIITKIQDEIKASSSSIHLLRSNKTKAQAQKELLDTELDLYKKGQAGEDTALLKIKYTQLQIEAAKRGLLARGRGALRSRGRGSRGRGSRGRGRGAPLYAVVDHRPRALEISGFSDAERVELLPHFAQFGEIEDCRIDDATRSAVITYRSRAEAEQAAVHGVKLSGLLRLSWYKPPMTMTTADHGEPEPDDEEFPEESMSDDAVLQDDDEEEDDNEPRSWRR